eukprot:maker-scaffold183_size276960-snap-gene-0.15 protein:Tk01751 transcript:maker-scaffold183_size276960-snap-gene-0.15-mRNA-1 annotation:"af353513_1mannose-6-phosphate insulin-like growth factor ii receptor"
MERPCRPLLILTLLSSAIDGKINPREDVAGCHVPGTEVQSLRFLDRNSPQFDPSRGVFAIPVFEPRLSHTALMAFIQPCPGLPNPAHAYPIVCPDETASVCIVKYYPDRSNGIDDRNQFDKFIPNAGRILTNSHLREGKSSTDLAVGLKPDGNHDCFATDYVANDVHDISYFGSHLYKVEFASGDDIGQVEVLLCPSRSPLETSCGPDYRICWKSSNGTVLDQSKSRSFIHFSEVENRIMAGLQGNMSYLMNISCDTNTNQGATLQALLKPNHHGAQVLTIQGRANSVCLKSKPDCLVRLDSSHAVDLASLNHVKSTIVISDKLGKYSIPVCTDHAFDICPTNPDIPGCRRSKSRLNGIKPERYREINLDPKGKYVNLTYYIDNDCGDNHELDHKVTVQFRCKKGVDHFQRISHKDECSLLILVDTKDVCPHEVPPVVGCILEDAFLGLKYDLGFLNYSQGSLNLSGLRIYPCHRLEPPCGGNSNARVCIFDGKSQFESPPTMQLDQFNQPMLKFQSSTPCSGHKNETQSLTLTTACSRSSLYPPTGFVNLGDGCDMFVHWHGKDTCPLEIQDKCSKWRSSVEGALSIHVLHKIETLHIFSHPSEPITFHLDICGPVVPWASLAMNYLSMESQSRSRAYVSRQNSNVSIVQVHPEEVHVKITPEESLQSLSSCPSDIQEPSNASSIVIKVGYVSFTRTEYHYASLDYQISSCFITTCCPMIRYVPALECSEDLLYYADYANCTFYLKLSTRKMCSQEKGYKKWTHPVRQKDAMTVFVSVCISCSIVLCALFCFAIYPWAKKQDYNLRDGQQPFRFQLLESFPMH